MFVRNTSEFSLEPRHVIEFLNKIYWYIYIILYINIIVVVVAADVVYCIF